MCIVLSKFYQRDYDLIFKPQEPGIPWGIYFEQHNFSELKTLLIMPKLYACKVFYICGLMLKVEILLELFHIRVITGMIIWHLMMLKEPR